MSAVVAVVGETLAGGCCLRILAYTALSSPRCLRLWLVALLGALTHAVSYEKYLHHYDAVCIRTVRDAWVGNCSPLCFSPPLKPDHFHSAVIHSPFALPPLSPLSCASYPGAVPGPVPMPYGAPGPLGAPPLPPGPAPPAPGASHFQNLLAGLHASAAAVPGAPAAPAAPAAPVTPAPPVPAAPVVSCVWARATLGGLRLR